MPGRKPETFQIGQKIAQAGQCTNPLRPIGEESVLLQKKWATARKRWVAHMERYLRGIPVVSRVSDYLKRPRFSDCLCSQSNLQNV